MTNEPENDRPEEDMPEPENALNEYDRIQRQLGEEFDGDPRLSSGVPQEQRGSDIEFIQMSGLVRPTPPSGATDASAHDDLDSSRPVSFFEKGVADVDADMNPGSIEDRSLANQEIRPVQQTQAAMSHLRDIIADLTKEPPTASTDPALMAALDTTETPAEVPAEPPPAEPVSLDDMLSEFASAHPMQDDAESSASAPEVPEPKPVEHSAPSELMHEEAQEAPQAAQPAEAAPEAPPRTRIAPVLPGHSAQLAEAEKLLDELEPATVSVFESTTSEPEVIDRPAPEKAPTRIDEITELPDEALDYKRQGKRRHRSPGKNPIARTLVRLVASLLVISAMAVATYVGYLWVQQRMASPAQLFNQASRLASNGDYAAASQTFENFASLHPNDPMRAEAQFNAAFTMQRQRPDGSDKAQEVTRQALRLFEQFVKDNPTHPKVARAETLMGRLNYESGRFPEAVELLRNPELRLRDPASAVPTLRTLARASAKMGDAEAARSYYLQAVGVQGNHSPDVDYAELGSLYQSRADHAEDLDKRIELQQLAIDSWTHALEVPGIDPSSKQTIRSQLDVLRERLQNEPGMAPAMESLDDLVDLGDEAAAAESGHADETQSADPEAAAANEPAAPSGNIEPTAETAVSTPDNHDVHETPAHAATEEPAAPAAPEPADSDAHGENTDAHDGEHVVKHGDTLASIAKTYHVSLDELKELNALSGDKVFEGQHLIVPAAQP